MEETEGAAQPPAETALYLSDLKDHCLPNYFLKSLYRIVQGLHHVLEGK